MWKLTEFLKTCWKTRHELAEILISTRAEDLGHIKRNNIKGTFETNSWHQIHTGKPGVGWSNTMKNNYVKCHFSLTKDFFFFTFSSQQFDYDMSVMGFFFFFFCFFFEFILFWLCWTPWIQKFMTLIKLGVSIAVIFQIVFSALVVPPLHLGSQRHTC